jgi:beta-glucosidase-like glycosyl hydrolase
LFEDVQTLSALPLKHFAAHGSPRSGLNAAPFMGRGLREVMQEMLVPFKAAIQLGGARGVMMCVCRPRLATFFLATHSED